MSRVFLNVSTLMLDESIERISQEMIESDSKILRNQCDRDRFAIYPTYDEVSANAKKVAMVRCVVNRLDIQYTPGKVLYSVVYVHPVELAVTESAEISAPADIKPVHVLRYAKSLITSKSDQIIAKVAHLVEELGRAANYADHTHKMAIFALRIFVPSSSTKKDAEKSPQSKFKFNIKAALSSNQIPQPKRKVTNTVRERIHL